MLLRRIFILTASACLWGQRTPTVNPMSGDAKQADQGRATFRIYCSPCHGIRAEGGRGPDLTRGIFVNGDRDEDLFQVIQEGVPGSEMPAFSAVFDDDNTWRLITYIRSATRRESATLTGNREAGEKLFWSKGGCGQCHTVGAQGRHFGPDLSRAGRTRSAAYLRQSIVEPDAEITPGYATIVVVTREGKTMTGVQQGYDNFSAQLLDSNGAFHSFQKSDVNSARREWRSLMPANYGKMFSSAELDDLVAYLASLRGEEVTQ